MLERTGKNTLGDPSFDRYARLVRAILDVPVALVSLVEPDRQVFVGQDGLAAPLDQERTTPLSQSICQYVVADSAPVILPDTRLSSRLVGHGAVVDLKVLAYAGYPLTDGTGTIVGSLCALDYETRDWESAELAVLEDLAAACSAELELREKSRLALVMSRALQDAGEAAQLLLNLSEDLARTRTLAEVAAALHQIALRQLGAVHAGLWIVADARARYVDNPTQVWARAAHHTVFGINDDNPIGSAILGGAPVYYAARAEQDLRHPGLRDEDQPGDGEARTFLPLLVAGEVLGCLVIMWPDEVDFDKRTRSVLRTLTAYTAQAVQRCLLLDERVTVATTLQNAMLSRLPTIDGVDLAARYRTAAETEKVGGDWYDVVAGRDGTVALVIGDVVGHDIVAAATMGQLRNMLRAFVWDNASGPSSVMTRLDRSIRDFEVGALATSALLMLGPDDGRSGRSLVWTNAGHPAPIVISPDGQASSLDGDRTDCMLGVAPDTVRSEHRASVAPGSTILLFTDGLIESRSQDLDAGRALLLASAQRHHALPVADLVDAVLADLLDEHPPDDVAVLAVRVGPDPHSD
ncbi:MAG: SpoIIE family protein phosphatase [Jatrophihabitans sp.]